MKNLKQPFFDPCVYIMAKKWGLDDHKSNFYDFQTIKYLTMKTLEEDNTVFLLSQKWTYSFLQVLMPVLSVTDIKASFSTCPH
jgi:hypothetical protein